MKKTFVWIGTVIGVAAVLALAFDVISRPQPPKTINVNGECLTTAPRDKVAITLRVTTLAPTAIESMRTATTQVVAITNELKSMPVEMQTTQFTSHEKTEWNREEQKSVSLGIETTIGVEVSANDIITIETILGKFAGAPNIYSENLRMYTSPETLKPIMEKCLTVAVENARARANALASADNKRAGKLLNVSYGNDSGASVYPASNLMRAKATMLDASFDASGTLVTSDTDVSVSVTAKFEIK